MREEEVGRSRVANLLAEEGSWSTVQWRVVLGRVGELDRKVLLKMLLFELYSESSLIILCIRLRKSVLEMECLRDNLTSSCCNSSQSNPCDRMNASSGAPSLAAITTEGSSNCRPGCSSPKKTMSQSPSGPACFRVCCDSWLVPVRISVLPVPEILLLSS